MKFVGFNWDKGNSSKCIKHGLNRKDIENFFLQKEIYIAPDLKHSTSETRFLAIGNGPDNKHIIIAFTFRCIEKRKFLRPISARFMHKKEVQKYEKEFKKNKDK